LEQVLKVIYHTFNFCKKVSINMELMQSSAAQMAHMALSLESHSSCSRCWPTSRQPPNQIMDAMHAICKKYPYNHVHDATSLQIILTELAGANGVRALKDAPAPNATTGHSVTNSTSFLNTMMNNNTTTSKYTKSAYGTSSDSGSLEEQCKSCKCEHKKTKMSKSHEKKKKEKDKDKEPKKNTCPHCKKYHRKKSHCVKPDKCMWNKKYKGYHFKLICDELKVAFKPPITFTANLGGYAAKEDLGSK
jgi:hypothetical protein